MKQDRIEQNRTELNRTEVRRILSIKLMDSD